MEALTLEPVDEMRVTNMYAIADPSNLDRTYNLTQYLDHLYENRPPFMMVGEAPGKHGCLKTGLPFTSERATIDFPFFEQ